MRVRAVQIWDHAGFGDLEVDFSDAGGRASRLVVLAGENGSGKTAILEAIFAAVAPTEVVAGPVRKLAPGHYRVLIETDGLNWSRSFGASPDVEVIERVRKQWPSFEGIVVDIDGQAVQEGRAFHKFHRMTDNTGVAGSHSSFQIFNSMAGCFFSEANVSFDVPKVESITTSAEEIPAGRVGITKAFPVRGGVSLGAEIAQLLVDLQAADDSDASRWLRKNEDGRPPPELIGRRIRRFTEAFALIDQSKQFTGFETLMGQHRPMFEQGGRRTALADLSTGEKQIVFRGAFLLRAGDELNGAIVLVDEPELSLHPKWQDNILSFYDKIVPDTSSKSSQIIVATHSPFIVHGSPTAKHIVLRRRVGSFGICPDSEPTFPAATATDVAVAAFDLQEFLRAAGGSRLSLIVEGPTDQQIIEAAWSKLRPNLAIPFSISSADGAKNTFRLLSPGGGKSGPLLDAIANSGTRLVGLFDFDHEGLAQWNGTIGARDAEPTLQLSDECSPRKRLGASIWVALLPVPHFRNGYASHALGGDSRLTIELLFPDEYVDKFLDRLPVAGDGQGSRLAATTNSKKVAVAQVSVDFPPDAFRAFEPILALLESIARQR